MRHALYFAFALSFVASISEARADQIVSYDMSGTITSVSSQSSSPLSFAVGDHLTWTLQYDSSAPMAWENVGRSGAHNVDYQMLTRVITNIVDQTTGYHLPTSPSSDVYQNGIYLSNQPRNSYQSYASGYIAAVYNAASSETNSSVGLSLTTFGLLPTLNLAQLQIDDLPPVAWFSQNYTTFSYGYQNYQDKVNFGFHASVNPLPGTTAATPEPGTITLFLLGVAGLVTRRIRHLCPV